MSTPVESATEEITAVIRKLEAANRQAVFAAVNVALGTTPKDASTGPTPVPRLRGKFLVVIGLMFIGSVAIAWWLLGGRELSGELNEFKTLMTLLGFAVALAAYLANVSREIVKRLSVLPDTDGNRWVLRENIAWTTTAEIQLVILGLLVIFRIASGERSLEFGLLSRPILLNNVIAIYLGTILGLLGYLHARTWRIYRPFRYWEEKPSIKK